MELTMGLSCKALDFSWPAKGSTSPPVLQAVDAVFPRDSVSLVTGATGAGKSTLLHLLAGLLRPTAGEVWADGDPVSRWSCGHRSRWRQQVGIVFQHLALIPDLSVAENLLLPLIPRELTWTRMQNAIHRQLAAVELSALATAPARALSGGQRQRLAIARALVGRPRFILADEPTAFQDDRQVIRIADQLAGAARQGAVVVVCSHDPRLRSTAGIDQRLHLEAASLARPAAGQAAP
jgi:putative ABC transport system ATP-binding protein